MSIDLNYLSNRLLSDRNFQKLPYYSQLSVRAKMLQAELAKDPQFQALPAESKAAVAQKLASRFVEHAIPAFENPMYYQFMQHPVMNGAIVPFLSKSIISKGTVAVSSGIEELLKLTGILPKTWVNSWLTQYSQDQMKLTEWTAREKLKNEKLPYTMAQIGEVADWIGISGFAGAIGGMVRGGGGALKAGSLAAKAVTEGGIRGMVFRAAARTTAMAGAGGLLGGMLETTGVGTTRALTTWLAKAAAGNATSAFGKAIGNWVVRGGASKLLSMGAREYLLNVVGAQLIRSTGAGLAGVTAGYIHRYATPNIPWAKGTEATFKDTVRTFGTFAGMDYLINVALNSVAPFAGLLGKSIGKGGAAIENLQELARYTPEQLEEFTRRLKLGTMDQTVWMTVPQALQDHLTSRAFYELVAANGVGAVLHDPVSTSKTFASLLNHDMVDAPLAPKISELPDWLVDKLKAKGLKTTDRIFSELELKDPTLVQRIASDVRLTSVQKEALAKSGFLPSEGGFYRIRVAPGTSVRQVIDGEFHELEGSTVIADGVRLPEANRILAERYVEARGSLVRRLEGEERELANLQEKFRKSVPTDPKQAAVEKQVFDFAVNAHQQKILGAKITLAAYDQYDPYLAPAVYSIERAKAGFVVGLVEDALPAYERSAISYGEASAVQAKEGLKTVRFRVDLPEGRLSGKEARVVRLGTQTSTVRDIKDFFVRQDVPFKITPAEGDFNALAVYSHPASERIVQQQYLALQHLKTPSTLDELVQARLQSLGFDAIEHADGGVTVLFPRTQIKHVSDMLDVKTGKYRAGWDKAHQPATVVKERPGLNPLFLSSLGKEVHIRQSLRIPISNRQLAESDRAMVMLMKTVYGDVHADSVKRIAQVYLKKAGKGISDLRVHLVNDLPIDEVAFRAEGGKQVLTVPGRIKTVKEQYDFIQKLGDVLLAEGKLGAKEIERFEGLWASMKDVELPGKRRYKEGSLPELGSMARKQGELGINKRLLRGLDEKITDAELEKIAVVPRTDEIAERVARKNIYASPLPDAKTPDKVKWLQAAAQDSKTAQFLSVKDEMFLKFQDGSEFRSTNVDELIDEFLVRNTSESVLRNELFDAMGYTLHRSEGGAKYQVLDNRKVLYEASSIPELLKTMNFRPERIDSVFAPKNVVVGAEGIEFELNGKFFIGSITDGRRMLDRYVDPAVEATRRTVLKTEAGKLSKYTDESWEVELPGWGIKRKFLNPVEARQYLEGRYQEYAEIERIANERGFLLRYQDGTYKLINETGTYHAKTKDEVGKILARSPDPSFAPNLIPEVDEATMNLLAGEARAAYAPSFWVLPGMPEGKFEPKLLGLTNLSQNLLPLHSWLLTYAKKSGQTRLAELYQGMETLLREGRRQINEVRRLGLYHLSDVTPSRRPGGNPSIRLFPEDKLRGMFHYLEQTTEEGRTGIVDLFKLERKHIDGALAIRDLMGTDPVKNPGLFGKFGIDSNLLLFAYMPRIRDAAAKLGAGKGAWKNLNNANTMEFLGLEWGGKENIPSELKFWAEKERLSDLVDFAREENIAKVFLKYNDRGHMKLFLNEQWRALDDYIKHSPVPLDETATRVTNRYREIVMGTYSPDVDQMIKQFGRDYAIRLNAAANKVRKVFGKETHMLSPDAGANLADLLFTSTTLTTQGYRFWLTARNMTQIYTTGGAMLGNRWIDAGQKRVLADPQDAIGIMRQRGSISEAPPLLNEVAKGESWITKKLGSITEVGMMPMKKSDDLSRAVVYFGAEERWNHYWKYREKIPDFNFKREAGVNLLHDDVRAKVENLLKQGSPEAVAAARHLYCDDMQRLTMFDYTRANTPRSFHGFVGRAFGQYQVYPVYYMAMIKHIMTHGDAGQRLGMVARLGLNALAVSGAMYAMGLEGKNSLPWVPAQISGGPFYNLAWDILNSTNTVSYKGAAARGELVGTLARLIPGSYEYKMISDCARYLQEGNPLLALYALSSAPIRQDLRWKK